MKAMLKRWFYIFILFLWMPLLAFATYCEIKDPASLDGWGPGQGWVYVVVWVGTLAIFFVCRSADYHKMPWQWGKSAPPAAGESSTPASRGGGSRLNSLAWILFLLPGARAALMILLATEAAVAAGVWLCKRWRAMENDATGSVLGRERNA